MNLGVGTSRDTGMSMSAHSQARPVTECHVDLIEGNW
jgi:hypothetical protein